MVGRIFVVLAGVLWMHGVARSTRAQDSTASAPRSTTAAGAATESVDEARAVFIEGKAAFEAGRFADALDRFRRSYKLSGQAALLFNIGLAADRLREDAAALDAFERYLRENPDGVDRPEVAQRVEALRASIERKRALSAERVAAAAPTTQASHATPTASESPSVATASSSMFERWWFWAAVGAVVAGGVGTAAVLSNGNDTTSRTEPRTDIVVMTLGSQP